MPRKRKTDELIAAVLRHFLQGEEGALVASLLWTGKSHDELVRELGEPSERDRKFYAAGRYCQTAETLLEMLDLLKKSRQTNSVLFA